MDYSSTIPNRENCRASVSDASAFHRKGLQSLYRLLNILVRYIVRDISTADAWGDHKSNFAAFKFFVELYCGENSLTRKFKRQTRWQPESLENINNCGALIRR